MSMATTDEVTPLMGHILRLEFDDGHVVVGFLVRVDSEHPGTELVYEPLEVLSPGESEQRVHPSSDEYVAASLSELVENASRTGGRRTKGRSFWWS